MDLLEMPVTLVVKAPNQKIADQTVECALDWTIRKLKSHLSTVYPSQPKEHQQRIIYSGKLLQDEMQLKDILRQIEDETIHTVHLVCSTPEFLTTAASMHNNNTNSDQNINPSTSETEGLRHRHTTSSDGSASTPATFASTSSTHQPAHSQEQQQPRTLYGAAPLPGMDNMGALGHGVGQVGNMAEMGAMPGMMPGMMPGYPYSPEQFLWLQQMYTQQMAQYMQYYQQGGDPQMPTPESPDQHPANQNVPAAAQPANQQAAPERNQPMVMNAAGEAVLDDDDDENANRDWLDWLYTLSRFGVLLSIVYFYSTFGRFLMVLGFFTFIYLYQMGWFVFYRNDRQRQREQERARQEAAQNAENARREDANSAEEEPSNTDEQTTTETTTAPPEPPRPGLVKVLFSFFLSFFTSLIPTPPPPVNVN